MKSKFLLIISLGLLLFTACDPNIDIYDEYESKLKPYAENLELTLTDADYTLMKSAALTVATNKTDTTNANAIATNKSFSLLPMAELIVPIFLEKNYIALDSSSSITLTYNYDYKTVLTQNQTDTVSAADYLTITGDVATNGFFNAANLASSKIPALLLTKFPTAVSGDIMVENFKYNDGTTTYNENLYFVFNGTSWAVDANVYVLTKADYNGMEISGSNLNFSTSKNPDFYIPIYFKTKFPYVTTTGTAKTVLYLYYESNKNYAILNSYYLYDGQWQTKEIKKDQFIHNGTAWFFDPTVRYLMVKTDYQIIVDYVINNPDLAIYKDPLYTNNEWYYGASAFYGNYDLRPSKHRTMVPGVYDGKTDSEITAILLGRIAESVVIMLTGRFPDAQPFLNGIPVYYEVTIDTYEPNRNKYKVKCLCTEVGKFEYVSGPTLVQ